MIMGDNENCCKGPDINTSRYSRIIMKNLPTNIVKVAKMKHVKYGT